MSDPKPISNPPVTGTAIDSVTLLTQKLKDDPDLLHKVIAGLALGGETAPANGASLPDLIAAALNAGGNILTPAAGTTVEKVDAQNNPLFFNSSKNNDSHHYNVQRGWGIQKEGDKIHKFDYEVKRKLGRAKRVFGEALDNASVELHKAIQDFKSTMDGKEINGGEDQKSQEDLMDLKTAPARENLAALIVAAYIDVVERQPHDMVSFVFLSEMSLLTLSYDVKRVAGSKKHVGGIALGLVVDLVATGASQSLYRKANKMMNEYFKDNITKESAKEEASKIHFLTNQYKKNFYRGVVARYGTIAVLADEAGTINGNANDAWVVALSSKAPTVNDLRNMEYKDIERIFEKSDVSPINQDLINKLYAGTTGGGKIPLTRRNLVEAGFDVKTVSEMEEAAKKGGKTIEKQSSEDILKILKEVKTLCETFRGKPAKQTAAMEKILKANEKTVEDKAKEKKAAESTSAQDEGTAAVAGGEGEAGEGGTSGGAPKWFDKIKEEGAKKLADDMKANNEDREVALSKAEKLLESMNTETGPALTAKQKEVAILLSAVAAPSFFGSTRMTGIQARQKELESMSTNFTDTTMNTLKPYAKNEDLVAAANGSRALRSVALYLKKDEPVVTASRILLKPPKSVTMSSPDLAFRSVFQRTSNEEETNSFINTIQTAGLGTATAQIAKRSNAVSMNLNIGIVQAGFSRSEGSVEKSSEKATDASQQAEKQETRNLATEAVVSEIVFMPMQSFFLQESSMELTPYAIKLYSLAVSPESAKRFIKVFGTHIPFGTQTLGGLFMRIMRITTTENHDVSTLYKAAALELKSESARANATNYSAGLQVNYMGMEGGVAASVENQKGSESGKTDKEANADGSGTQYGVKNALFESNVVCFGPKAKTSDDLYQQLMKNNATWTIIDRGEVDSYLPIWELMEFNRPNEFGEQNRIVKETWRQMARKHITADDVDIQRQVLGYDSLSNISMILKLLVRCMVPSVSGNFDDNLASQFEKSMMDASKSYSEDGGKGSLLDFIKLAGIPDLSTQTQFSIVTQSEPFTVADEYFRDLEGKDMTYFNPASASYDGSTSSSPYTAVKRDIRNRGTGGKNVLLASCEESISGDTNGDFRVFEKLYDFYKLKDYNGVLLKEQMQAKESKNSRNSFHYVAERGSEDLISKVLELPKVWSKPSLLPNQKYLQYLVLKYYTPTMQPVSTRTILKGRPDLEIFMEKLEPPQISTIIKKASKKEAIIKALDTRNKALIEINLFAYNARNRGWIKRNLLAVEESERLLKEMEELRKRVNDYQDETQVLNYAQKQLRILIADTEKRAQEWEAYRDNFGNDYAMSICKEAAGIFKNALKDLAIMN